MSTSHILDDMSFAARRASDRSWFAATCARGAEIVQQSMAAREIINPQMTTAEVGAAFQPEEPIPTRAEIKAAKLAKAKAVLHRAKPASECDLTVVCPRHPKGTVDVTVTFSDSWALKEVPDGCDLEAHGFTPEERATLSDRIDVAYGNRESNQEERPSSNGGDFSGERDACADAGRRFP